MNNLKRNLKKLLLKCMDAIPSYIAIKMLTMYHQVKYKKYVEYLCKIKKNNISAFDKNNLQRILVVRLDGVGDFVWTTPLLRELHCLYPNASIDIIINSNIKSLAQGCPYVTNVYAFNSKRRGKLRLDDYNNVYNEIMEYIKREKISFEYDVAILPRPFEINAFIENYFFPICLNAKKIIGVLRINNIYDEVKFNMFKVLFDGISRGESHKHEVETILGTIGYISGKVHDNDAMELWPENIEKTFLDIFSNRKYIFLGLEGSSQNRNWDVNKYIELIKRIHNYKEEYYFVLCGEKETLDKADFIVSECRSCVCNFVGKTNLNDVVNIMNECYMYIGSDTGLMHIAAALKKPVVEISAYIKNGTYIDDGGNPVKCGPWRVKNIVLQPKKGMDGCNDQCMMPYAHCINQISVDEVYEAFLMLKNTVER